WIVETEKPRSGRPNIDVAMRTMPAGGEWHFGLRIPSMFDVFVNCNHIDFPFAKSERDLDCLCYTGAVLPLDRDSVLDGLHTRAPSIVFWFCISALSLLVLTVSVVYSEMRRA